jgi:streptogrisin C
MRGGIEIRKGSTSGSKCTMSFHVMYGTDAQFLTAGHCGYAGSDNWKHPGYGSATIGSELSSVYLSGTDAMRVSLVQNQDSNRVYTNQASNFVTMNAAIWPVIGQVVRLSGSQGGWRGGTTGEACGCTQWGADASYTMLEGDSGGPVVQGSATTGSANGIGIAATLNGRMAILPEALDGLGATLMT